VTFGLEISAVIFKSVNNPELLMANALTVIFVGGLKI